MHSTSLGFVIASQDAHLLASASFPEHPFSSPRRRGGVSVALLLAAFLMAGGNGVGAANWPAWRGPEGTGVCAEKGLPTRWGPTENVRWKVALPERGNSTPIVWGNRIFVTQSVGNDRLLFCFDRRDGRKLWQAGAKDVEKELTHGTNPYCAGSPVTDGERVYAAFGSAGLWCFDFEGKEVWHRDLGKQRHIWGNAGSPVLHGNLCVLNFGPGERTFLIAVDKATGKTVWQNDEPGGDSGEKRGDAKVAWVGSWSTPVAMRTEAGEQLVMTFPKRVVGLDPRTGKEVWTSGGINPLVYTSPIYGDGIVVAMGGFNGMTVAVKAGGSGDVTTSHRVWQHPRTKQRIGSGVIHDGHVYILNDPGVAECFELKTGRLVWEERLKGQGAKADNWSSLVLADGLLYGMNQAGDCPVFKASPKFELVSMNPLGEASMSSVAPSNGELFLRTYKSLWCIAGKK